VAAPARPIGRTFVYGSVAFVRALRNVAGWGEQIAWTKDALCAAKWRDAYAERYIGSGGRALPTSDVAGALPAAVRPLYGDKAFPGGIYSPTTWVDPAAPGEAWVAPIVPIEREVRVWFVGGKPRGLTGVVLGSRETGKSRRGRARSQPRKQQSSSPIRVWKIDRSRT